MLDCFKNRNNQKILFLQNILKIQGEYPLRISMVKCVPFFLYNYEQWAIVSMTGGVFQLLNNEPLNQ